MGAMTMVLDERRWTREERDALPEDRHRHELIDGALVVTQAPRVRHQSAVFGLAQLLAASCPPGLQVFVAPLDVTLADDTVMEPDVLVVRRDQARGETLEGVPLLAVEVSSPSTAAVDRNLKLPRFERAGCPSFWIVDPAAPSVSAWELDDAGRYAQVAHVEGAAVWAATAPFDVTVCPSELLG